MNYIVMSVIMYALVFLLTIFSIIKTKDSDFRPKNRTTSYVMLGLGLLAVFFLQMYMAPLVKSYDIDINLFKKWASMGDEHHLWNYYTEESFHVDYPPLLLYVLFGVGKLAKLFGVPMQSQAYVGFVKAPAIVCDAVTTLLIFLFARDKIGEKKAAALAFLSAVNPANIVNSTIWGQVDSISAFIVVATILCLYHRKYIWSAVLMAAAILAKPQNIVFLPVFGLTFLFDLAEAWQEGKKSFQHRVYQSLYAAGAFFAVLLLVSLPVSGGKLNLVWDIYTGAMAKYQYSSMNAANLFSAFGRNAVPDKDPFLFVSYKTFGYLFIVLMICALIFLFWKSKDRTKIVYGGAFTIFTIYLFMHNIHERYLYPLMLILIVLYLIKKEDKVLWLYGGVSVVHFWNVAALMQLAAKSPKNPYFAKDDVSFILLSWIHIALYAMLVYMGLKWYIRQKETVKNSTEKTRLQKTTEKKAWDFKIHSLQDEQEKVSVTRIDLLIIVGLMLVYSLFAFYRLGSTDVPQTGWYPENANESIVFDIDSVQPIKRIYIHYGWMDRRKSDQSVKRDLTIECSKDGEEWEEVSKETIKDVFKFAHWNVDIEAQYIRITADDGRFYLNELALYGASEQRRYAMAQAYSPSGNPTAALAIDEQDKMVYQYTWFDEAYFDEIYHPRTAYENLTHRYPFENTHPPLGKLFIAAGMKLFGVTPFGWRFFGTLSGVLMIPLTYLLGKRMFRKSFYGFATAALFTFDFMHLSQTRLATIDSFTTLFTMGMFYYMYQYYTTSFYNVGVKKTLYPLFMSGLFFALGIATKWQGAYAGIGLAVLFFMSLGRRWREYKFACASTKKDDRLQRVVQQFKPMAIQTLLFAVLFFVVIPGIIYFLSYIPAMDTPSTGLKFFFTNQTSMFNYHSGLDATHPYGSQWWSWPLDIRPLYSYTAKSDFLPEGMSMGMASFGNPLVWWMMVPALAYAIYCCCKRRGSKELTVMLTGFAAMYVPWMLVTRVCFIYHFFPVVIFGILMIVYMFKTVMEREKLSERSMYITFGIYIAAVFALFVAFYPVLTGLMIPRSYMLALKWLPTWVFG